MTMLGTTVSHEHLLGQTGHVKRDRLHQITVVERMTGLLKVGAVRVRATQVNKALREVFSHLPQK